MKAIIAIPCYNCEVQLPRVLNGISSSLAAQVDAVWVVDNGSSDGTLGVAREYRRNGRLENLRVFQNLRNVSLGGTHKIVFNKARMAGATHVVILHGDDQATASEARDLLQRARSGSTQTVLGSRFGRHSRLYGYDWKRIVGNRALNIIFSAVAARRLEDLGSGLNLFRLSDLEPDTYMRFGDSLSFNYELILDLVRRDVPFQFHPITWSESDQTSNTRNVRIFLAALGILLRWRFHRTVDGVTPRSLDAYDWQEVE